MKVTFFSTKPFELLYLENANGGNHELNFFPEALSLKTADRAAGSDAICIFANDDASSPVLEKLASLGITHIASRCAGTDNIDIKKAEELGIYVANVPQYSPHAIAEHAVAIMMAMNRKIVRSNQKVKEYDFRLDELVGFDMNGRTAGIIGTGNIGGIVAKILNGFGCKLLAFDPCENKELEKQYNLRYVSLEELFEQADIISIHAPLNAHTRHMISKPQFDRMKKGVMIVNTGRGPIIDTQAAIEALKEGKIGYLGLDVYEFEKGLFFHDHSKDILEDDTFARLLSFKNVLITGHQAFLTENALKNIADTTFYNLNCWARVQPTENEVGRIKVC